MGWDINLVDPVTKETLQVEVPHQLKGGTYAVGGTTDMWLSVTYNYSEFYRKYFPNGEGIDWLDEKLAAETIATLQEVIKKLGDDVTERYWDATEGNAKRALYKVLGLAQMRPDGLWMVS